MHYLSLSILKVSKYIGLLPGGLLLYYVRLLYHERLLGVRLLYHARGPCVLLLRNWCWHVGTELLHRDVAQMHDADERLPSKMPGVYIVHLDKYPPPLDIYLLSKITSILKWVTPCLFPFFLFHFLLF